MKKFGWAVIGCGTIAEKVFGEVLKEDSGEVVSVYNRTAERAQRFTAKFGGKVYPTAEEALKAEGVKGVYVATTHDMHAHYTKLALNLGIPVLCEKPLTVNTAMTQELFAYAKDKNVYLAEAMWTWHNPVSLKVREWLNAGKIGKVKSVKVNFAVPMLNEKSNPRLFKPELIGGALMDIGIYPIRYVYELFGYPQNIVCKAKLAGGVDTEEDIRMSYSGFDAELFVSMTEDRGVFAEIIGTEGRIYVPQFYYASTASLISKHSESFRCNELLYALELKHTAEDIVNGRKMGRHCPVKSTVDTMKLLDECRKQAGVIYPCEIN